MVFLNDLQEAIKKNKPLPPLLDSCIRPPKHTQNPPQNQLVSWARALFGDFKLQEYIIEAIKENLFSAIRDNQDALRLLNTEEGRKYLHKNLDSLLDYLTGTRFAVQYKCPKCSACFPGKRPNCPRCGISLKWK